MTAGSGRFKFARFASFLLALVIVAGGVGYYFYQSQTLVSTKLPQQQKSTKKASKSGRQIGPSGLPIPRFVSLKRSKVNVRLGPSSDHKIAWAFHYKGLPVEIIAEFEHWRRIRDSDGQEGWVYHSLLAGKRTVTVAPWRKGDAVGLRKVPQEQGAIIAKVSAGVIGEVATCTGDWCEVELQGYQGWIKQTMLWGVYPNEPVKR